MSLQQILLALRARIRVFAVVLGATVLAATLVSLLLPKSYKATVSLLVDAKEEQSLSNALRPLILPQERLSYLQTQMDIMTSRKVARKVVQELKLEDDPAARASVASGLEGSGSLEERLAESLLRRFKVETSQSNVIQASFIAADPHFAARVANAFAKAYADTMLELRVEPTREAAVWFDEQLKSLRASLEDAQKKLTDYYQRKEIVSTDERYDAENTRLGALSEQAARGQEQTFQWSSRARQARRSLEQGGSPEKLPEVLDNAFIQRLKADLAQAEARLQQLATQYGSKHPQYQRQVTENQALREKLDAEMRKVADGIESSARQSREREADLEQAMAVQRARILKLKENRNELTVLRRNVESAERAYDTAMQRFVVSRVESRASQANVAVLNPAVAPWTPTRPRLGLNIALSIAVGTLLGLSAVILMELVDRRVRSASDLLDGWDLPLLGVFGGRSVAERARLGRQEGSRRALPSPS